MAIELDKKALKRAQEYLSGIRGGYETAVSRAMNRAISSTTTFVTKQVTADYTLKSKYVKADVKVTKASKTDLTAIAHWAGARQSEAHFKISPRVDTTRSHRPVTVEEKRGSKRVLKRGFVWEGDKVMQRISAQHSSKEPTKAAERNLRGLKSAKGSGLEKITAPAVAQIAGEENRMAAAEEHMQEAFSERLDHEVEALLNGWSK